MHAFTPRHLLPPSAIARALRHWAAASCRGSVAVCAAACALFFNGCVAQQQTVESPPEFSAPGWPAADSQPSPPIALPPAAQPDADSHQAPPPEADGNESIDPQPAGLEPEPADEEADSPLTDEELDDVDPSALDDFSEPLAPYGRWVEDARYGTVWVPYPSAVGSRFAPYVSRGHWALTADNQWIWVSDYPFGWVVFHYGRWVWSSHHGWCWIAGRRYSHAWVSFRVGSDPYIGWAPMAPRWVWRSGAAVWIGTVPPQPYVFVPVGYVFYPSVYSYVVIHPARIRHLARRSHRYVHPGVPSHRYVSPPIERIPARARPSGRTRPDSRAIGMQRQAATASPSRTTSTASKAPRAEARSLRVGGESRASPQRLKGSAVDRASSSGDKRWTGAPERRSTPPRVGPKPRVAPPAPSKRRRIQVPERAENRRRRIEPPAKADKKSAVPSERRTDRERRADAARRADRDRQTDRARSAKAKSRERSKSKAKSDAKRNSGKTKRVKPEPSRKRIRLAPGAERRRVFPGASKNERFGVPRRLPVPERSQRKYK